MVKKCLNCELNVPENRKKYCCKKCVQKAWYKNNREKVIAKANKRIKENPKRHQEYVKRWRERNYEKNQTYLKKAFGTKWHSEYMREYSKRELPSTKIAVRLATRKFRKAILNRDGNKCTKCNSKRDLQIHHKTYVGCKIEDMISLCKTCHLKIHGKKRRRI